MQATMVLHHCKGCGKTYQVDLSEVETRFGRFHCHQCNTATTVENPNYQAPAEAGEALDFDTAIPAADSGEADFDVRPGDLR